MCVAIIIETAIIWVVIGFFINYKRNWYLHLNSIDANFQQWMNVVFAPIALLIALYNVFINDKWKNG